MPEVFYIPLRVRLLMDRMMQEELHGIGYESDGDYTEDYDFAPVTPPR